MFMKWILNAEYKYENTFKVPFAVVSECIKERVGKEGNYVTYSLYVRLNILEDFLGEVKNALNTKKNIVSLYGSFNPILK